MSLTSTLQVDPLTCPNCQGTMRILACITQASVIAQILTHLRTPRAATRRAVHPPEPPKLYGLNTSLQAFPVNVMISVVLDPPAFIPVNTTDTTPACCL